MALINSYRETYEEGMNFFLDSNFQKVVIHTKNFICVINSDFEVKCTDKTYQDNTDVFDITHVYRRKVIKHKDKDKRHKQLVRRVLYLNSDEYDFNCKMEYFYEYKKIKPHYNLYIGDLPDTITNVIYYGKKNFSVLF